MTAVTPVTYPDVVSPAESAAASLCWLARFKLRAKYHGDKGIERIGVKVDQFWHDKPCRYCKVPMEELMTRINRANADLLDPLGRPIGAALAFNRLSPAARTQRVREAQEENWLDELTRTG